MSAAWDPVACGQPCTAPAPVGDPSPALSTCKPAIAHQLVCSVAAQGPLSHQSWAHQRRGCGVAAEVPASRWTVQARLCPSAHRVRGHSCLPLLANAATRELARLPDLCRGCHRAVQLMQCTGHCPCTCLLHVCCGRVALEDDCCRGGESTAYPPWSYVRHPLRCRVRSRTLAALVTWIPVARLDLADVGREEALQSRSHGGKARTGRAKPRHRPFQRVPQARASNGTACEPLARNWHQ